MAADSVAWCESANDRFQLISDLPEADQQALLTNLARFETIAEPFLPGEPLARNDRLKLIVFRTRKDFLALTGERRFAGYMQPSLQTNRLLIGPVRGDLEETTLHEYAHYLMRNRTGVSLPLWFDEGLATLLGTTRLDANSAVVGDIPVSRLESRINRQAASQTPQQKLNRALKATDLGEWHGERINEFYDLAWLLTHYLYFNVYRDDLANDAIRTSGLTDYLNERDSSLPEHLGIRPSQLPRTLEQHLRRWRRPDATPTGAVESEPVQFRCLTPFERDLNLALSIHTSNPGKARSLLTPYATPGTNLDTHDQIALKVALARIARAEAEPEAAEVLVGEALALDPRHAEATILAADLSVQTCLFERTDECFEAWQAASSRYRAALRVDPSRYDGILGIGLAELHRGRAGDAVNYLRIAYARAPWAAVINYYLGESYRLTGDSRATTYLTNARSWAVQDIWRLLAEESLRLAAEEAASDS